MTELSDFYSVINGGESRLLSEMFPGEPWLDDPRFGRIEGSVSLLTYLEECRQWLDGAQADLLAVTETPAETVAEFVLHAMKEGSDLALPVAIAGDRAGSGSYSRIRVYHSMWPELGRHVLRPPLLPEDSSLVISDIVGKYHDALTRGDIEAMMAVFEDDGYAREPAGGQWVYQGKERLREFYGLLFSNGGGIGLEHCAVTDDGVRCALEYNAVRWGKDDMPSQAGIAVYERGAAGLLRAARIYDDVNPPMKY